MKRTIRKELAEQTVAISHEGRYVSANGHKVDLSESVGTCLAETRYFTPEELGRLRRESLADSSSSFATAFEVVNETTLQGIERLWQSGREPIAALNFASARNPGGGFLNGSQAQEESLARSSALYASQMRAFDFYHRHRAASSLLYSDSMILSPSCPIFRDDDGILLDQPRFAAFITSAAPNAGAMSNNARADLAAIPDTFRRRCELVLALAAAHGYRRLVLGAWGCGVFRNDPKVVASAFADHLLRGMWVGRFERVVFSVLDRTPSAETFDAFRAAFASE